MNSSENIGADATHQKMNFDSSTIQEASVANPILKDQKRVIRKMVVMNTNKLKGLGIESTIKNAMSKLEKDKNDKSLNNTTLSKPINQSTSQMRAVKPKLVSSRSTIPLLNNTTVTSPKTMIPASSIVLTSPTMNHADRPRPEFSKIIIPVTKQVVQQTLVSSNSATSARYADVVYSKSKIRVVKHMVQSRLTSSKSPIPAVKHAETITLPSTSKHTIPLTRRVPQPPVASTTFVKQQHNAIANCLQNAFENSEALTSSKIKIETHETKDVAIINATSKPNETTQTVASDAKKIKVLSDVSLNDTKAKLLEIDKLSSKNLKLTNVIKGTDKLVNSKTTSPMPLTSSPLKMVLPTKSSPHRMIKINIPAEPKKSRKGNFDPCALELTKHTAIWATTNPRTYARDDVKKLLNAKIMNKTRLQEKTIPDKVICQSHKEPSATIPFHEVESRSETEVKLPKEPPSTIRFHAVESKSETEVKLPKKPSATIPFHAVESRSETEVKLPKEPPSTIPFHAVESRSETEVKLAKEPPSKIRFHAVESKSETEVKLPKKPSATIPFHAVESRSETEVKLPKEPPSTIPFHAVESRSETEVKLPKKPSATIPFHAVESRSETEVKLPKEPPSTIRFHAVESKSETEVKLPKKPSATIPFHAVESRSETEVKLPKEPPSTIPFHAVESRSETEVKLPKEPPSTIRFHAVESKSETEVKLPKKPSATIPFHAVESRSETEVKLPKEPPSTIRFHAVESKSETEVKLPKKPSATIPFHAVESRSETEVKLPKEPPSTIRFHAVESKSETEVKLPKKPSATIPFHAVESRSETEVKLPKEPPSTIPFHAVESRSETEVKLPKEPPSTIRFHAVESKSETEVKLPKKPSATIPFHAVESRSETEVKLPKEPPSTIRFHAVESKSETEVKLPKKPSATIPFHAVESRSETEVKLPKEPPSTIPFHAVESRSETGVKLPKEPPSTIPFHAVESRSETEVKLAKKPPSTIRFHAVESRSETEVKLPKKPSATIPFHAVESKSEAKVKPPVDKKDAGNKDSASVNHLDAKPIPAALPKNLVELKPIRTKNTNNAASETRNTYSEHSPMENEFYGFSIEEVNKSADNWNRHKLLLLKKIERQALFTQSVTITNSTNVSKLTNVESANNQLILNCKTGIMEEVTKSVDCNKVEVSNKLSTVERTSSQKIARIDDDLISNQQTGIPEEVPQTVDCSKAEVYNKSLTEKSISPKKNSEINADLISMQPKQQLPLITQVLEVNMSKAQISLPASPVRTAYKGPVLTSSSISPFSIKSIIEDADDEISDIDTVHRRKTNSRATFKTFENHRKAWNPSTTDDESELSLSVRPPRPKLRKSRHKQTMEQMKIQQNAHLNLLKRFNQPDSQKNIWNDEMIVSFIDGLPNRVDALNVKVKKCFDRAVVNEPNLENVSDKEHLINVDSVAESLINVDPVATSSIEPVKVNVNECSVEVNEVPRSSVIVCESQLPQKSLSKSESMENTDGTIDADGPSKIHKITIQKETFLVTEVENNIDIVLPTPSITHVKLEKEESPQPCSSLNTIHIKKDPELVRRKKNSKQPLQEMLAQYPKHSLVKMLAQYVDEDTLKSVILEHDEQYIVSDSDEPLLESDSDTDSDSDTSNDNVNKIFKTILTIDLCDDDDETVHEDVLHLLNDNSNIDDREMAKDSDSAKNDASSTPTADNKRENMQSRKIIDNQPMRIKSELPNIPCTLSETIVLPESTPFTDKTLMPSSVTKNSSVENEKPSAASNHINVSPVKIAVETAAISTKTLLSQEECTRSGPCNEVTSFIPMEIANSMSRDMESNSSHDFGDSESPTEFNKNDDDEVNNRPSDVTRYDDVQRANQVNELELNLPEARPLGQIANGLIRKDSQNELLKTNINVKKKPFDDVLTEADYTLVKRKKKRKSLLKDEELRESDVNQQKSYKNLKLSEISSERKSLIEQSSGSNKSSKSMGQPREKFHGKISVKSSAEMLEKYDQNIKLSVKESVEMQVNSDPNTKLTSIDKTQIEVEKESSPDSKSIDPVSTVLEPATSNIPKPSRSRKRKLDKSVEVVCTAESTQIEDRPIPKRPIFEYFRSPEILITKRARKSKCYADCETSDDVEHSKNRSVRQSARQPIRRSNVFHDTVDTQLTDVELHSKLSYDVTEAPSSTSNCELSVDKVPKSRSARQPTRKSNSQSKVSQKAVDTEGETKFKTDSRSHTPLISKRATEPSKSSFPSETPSTDVKKRESQSARQLKRKPTWKVQSISDPDVLLDIPLSNYVTAVTEKQEYSAESKVDLVTLKTGSAKKPSKTVPMQSATLSVTGDPDVISTLNSQPNVTSNIPQSGDIVEKSSSIKVEKQKSSPDAAVHLIPSITGRGKRPPELAPVKVAALYTCGNCKAEVRGKEWKKHLKSHYGLAWRTDIDPPYDLENTNSMTQRIIYFIKKENIRFLKCEKCGAEKKSALGYLSHVELCGLTDDEFRSKLVKCEYCPKVVRSCSVRAHESSCTGLKKLWAKEKAAKEKASKESADSMPKDDCYNDQGRIVRQSAKKALTSFKEIGKAPEAKVEDYIQRAVKVHNKQQRKWTQLLKNNVSIDCVRLGCSFTAEDMPTMLQHFNTCLLINGETFYCSRCDHGPDNRDIIVEHIKANHTLGVIEAINDVDFSDSDDDAEVGEESEESEGESGVDETIEKDFEQNDEIDDEDDDGWNTRGYKRKRIRDSGHNEAMINNCLDRKVLNEHATLLRSYSSGPYFQPSLEWTQDFRDKHFSTVELFPFAMPNKYSVLNSCLADAYAPKISKSNKFFTKQVRKYNKHFGSTEVNKTDQWMTLKKFEAIKQDDSIIFFTGGPIISMAWLPVPDDHTLSQILAVCCRNDPNEHILLNDSKQTKCLIQIWNFNNLKNNQLRRAQAPQLLYSIAYDYGPVIQMEFCPSGGFTEDRLGLLAVSTCDGHVDLLALPKNITCDNSTVSDLIFAIKPSLVLCCDLNEPLGVLITKLAWSQSKGHTKLAAGYSNGMVAIWNFKNVESPNICNRINGTLKLLPTDMFFAAHKCIRLLEFHHDEKNEPRWLVVGSHDRKVRFYDTHNVFLEISTAAAHSRIVAGCWPMHWTTFLIGIDNAYSFKIAGIVVKQPLDIGCRTGTFYSCIGSTCDISFNNWLNSYVFVSSYGDIYVQYIRQMISGFSDIRRQRFIIGYTDMINIEKVDFNENNASVAEDNTEEVNEPQPSTSSAVNCQQSDKICYPTSDGIVFCDFDTPLPAITSPTYEKIRAPPMDTFNMVKVNKILFNPNVSAYRLYALGYESGFVRIKQLKQKQL